MLPEFSVSDDDEIDYSIKPEFYDPDLDDKDEVWVRKKTKGRISDAVLSCPGCFTTLCLECQRYVYLIHLSLQKKKNWVKGKSGYEYWNKH